MPELPDEEQPPRSRDFPLEVAAREDRKIQARKARDRTVWFGLGMFGLVGWSVALPTVLGVALGVWLDSNWPGRFSWTLALLLAGASLGALNAWYWVSQEQEAMERERERQRHE